MSKMKKYRPVTAGSRQLVLPTFEELTRRDDTTRARVKPTKSLLRIKKSTGGRNNLGRITCRHRGGGHKKFYRIIDFKRDKDLPATIKSIEYDPNRSAFIALVVYCDGEKRYILATEGMKAGDKVLSGPTAPFKTGCALPLKAMPLGSFVHNIELNPGRGGKLVRAAGLSAQLMAKTGGYATLKMPSGEVRMVNEDARATLGVVSNGSHNLRVESKAGRMRWQGIRPTVRGTAMNPVDHPHGGGEGRHNGYIPQTPWAMQTKGFKTRCKRKSNKLIVKDRRK
jgi:large subunit ribosomal protein L2